jgi:serine/threonine-protein kinase HSL1, negative regulator of Swe1 kinase
LLLVYTISAVLGLYDEHSESHCNVHQKLRVSTSAGQLAGTPGLVAVKVLDTKQFRNIHDIDVVGNELGVMQTLRHPNIIEMVDVIFRESRFYIILELADGGDLRDWIVQEGPLSEADCQRLFQQCVGALSFCQRRHICHRDLKPENILLDSNHNAKIADFGLASVVAPGENFGQYCGTPAFSAPEAFSSEAYEGGPADVWSLGIVMYECLTGKLPFAGGSGGVAKLVERLQRCVAS